MMTTPLDDDYNGETMSTTTRDDNEGHDGVTTTTTLNIMSHGGDKGPRDVKGGVDHGYVTVFFFLSFFFLLSENFRCDLRPS
jgi:hypothetical protein